MMSESKSWDVFTKLLKNWDICAVDSVEKLGGFLLAWNPTRENIIPYSCATMILLVRSLKDWLGTFHLINCYGPYVDRQRFWDLVN